MRIAVLVNHAYPSTGGCEKVIHELGKRWCQSGHRVVVYASNINDPISHDHVRYASMRSFLLLGDEGVKSKLDRYDAVLVYSDLCQAWPCILRIAHDLKPRCFVVPLGAYCMRSRGDVLGQFLASQDHFTTINHSNIYEDAEFCRRWNIPFEVIPNGVSLQEMIPSRSREDFFADEGIVTPYMVYCVANFFPGKGHDHLAQMLRMLGSRRRDFTFVLAASKSNISSVNALMSRYPRLLDRADIPYRLFFDRPRQDIVDGYFAADAFLFPSQKEVSPLVLLEAMSARLPWVSLDVGNASELKGGVIVNCPSKDALGFWKYNTEAYSTFCKKVNGLLNNRSWAEALGNDGRLMVEQSRNWDIISGQYLRLFHG